MAIIVERPIAESIEYRPPTQSQKPNIFAVSMPKADTFSAFVETARQCLATAFWSFNAFSDHSRALWALVIVSSVVKVLEDTMNKVSAGSRSRVASTRSMPSTFETKRNVMVRSLKFLSRSEEHTSELQSPYVIS